MKRNILIYLFIALIGMGIGGLMVWENYHDEKLPLHNAIANGNDGELTPARNTPVVAAVRKASPAVVGITTRSYARDIFNRKVVVGEGVGSGVIFSEQGYIVTNHHVVEGKQSVTVSLADGRSFTGQVVGGDPATDLAVVKIDADQLPTAVFGDSDTLQVGEPAIAIGNPLGMELRGSVTVGIISALSRTITVDTQEFYLVQTDAAINPGNSGGALINADGELIGINSAKISQSGIEGIGFAIPINNARPIIDSLVAHGRVIRPSMGIGVADALMARRYGYSLPDEKGLLVVQIARQSPAAQSGIKVGDIILTVDGQEVNRYSGLRMVLESHSVGDQVAVVVNRKGETFTYHVRLSDSKE